MTVGIAVGLSTIAWIVYEVMTAPEDPNDRFDREHEECVKARQNSS